VSNLQDVDFLSVIVRLDGDGCGLLHQPVSIY